MKFVTLRNTLDLGIILDREQRATQEEQTSNEREADRPQHASWSIALRISRLLTKRASGIEAVDDEEGHEQGGQESARNSRQPKPGVQASLRCVTL